MIALVVPAVASAGTYTWDLNSNFTATAPGANPDHDLYGGAPWTYEEGGGTKLPAPLETVDGGLAAWHDTGGTGNQPLVGVNPTGSPISHGTATFPAGQMVLQPSAAKPAVVTWTAPLSGTIQIAGSVVQDDPGTALLCTDDTTWSLTNGTTTLVNGSTPASTPHQISTATTVQAGDRISLSVSLGLLAVGNSACDSTGVTFTITAPSTIPSVTLARPVSGGLISGAQPTFIGTASAGFGMSNQVTIKVYSGSIASGSPFQTIVTNRSGTSFSTGPTAALPDGLYTAVAEQSNALGETGDSQASVFRLQNATPSITLDSLGTKPLTTATPTFTGVAAHSATVNVVIYPGTSTNATPAEFAVGRAGSDGKFSLALAKPLADGQYTAVATDSSGGASRAMPFRIKVHPPAFTVTAPAPGAHTSDSEPTFAGSGGTALGDSSRVSVTLFSGGATSGKNLGSAQATVSGGSWSLRWGHRLSLGIYTFQASQSDDAGHTTTVKRSFVIVPAPSTVGSSVSISRSGFASVPIACTAPSGHVCTGNVLVLTLKSYRTVPGGPAGKIRVLFAYVRIAGGTTQVVKRKVQSDALHALRHLHGVQAKVIATLKDSGGPTKTVSAQRSIRFASR